MAQTVGLDPTQSGASAPTEDAAPITVAELVIALLKLPQDAPVVTSGYEEGYTAAETPRLVEIGLRRASWYYGEYTDGEAEAPKFTAVYLPGGRH